MPPKIPSYRDFTPSSERASRTLSRTRKRDTRCEVVLRRELWHRGFRYRKHHDRAPGTPDIAFPGPKLAVFCDGDFWHGRDWEKRQEKLKKGSNPAYWIAKIERNRERDRETNEALKQRGWTVLRFWETEILKDPSAVADEIIQELESLRAQ